MIELDISNDDVRALSLVQLECFFAAAEYSEDARVYMLRASSSMTKDFIGWETTNHDANNHDWYSAFWLIGRNIQKAAMSDTAIHGNLCISVFNLSDKAHQDTIKGIVMTAAPYRNFRNTAIVIKEFK